MLDIQLTQEQHNYLKNIHVSAVTLGYIFNDIIEMDKLERRKVRLDNQSLDFTDFLMDLENLSGLLVQPKRLNLVMAHIRRCLALSAPTAPACGKSCGTSSATR